MPEILPGPDRSESPLGLGHGLPNTTTELWGDEACISESRKNNGTATHSRAGALEVGVPLDEKTGQPKRLLEDRGVCLSSCLDYWEDDLFLQACSRNLILAPELYGSPWFPRDEEFAKLARIYNLARRYHKILPQGMRLKDKGCGTNAVLWKNPQTRIHHLVQPNLESRHRHRENGPGRCSGFALSLAG